MINKLLLVIASNTPNAKPSPFLRRRLSAFTVMELLLVMTVASIVGTISVKSVQNAMKASAVRKEAGDFVAFLRRAVANSALTNRVGCSSPQWDGSKIFWLWHDNVGPYCDIGFEVAREEIHFQYGINGSWHIHFEYEGTGYPIYNTSGFAIKKTGEPGGQWGEGGSGTGGATPDYLPAGVCNFNPTVGGPCAPVTTEVRMEFQDQNEHVLVIWRHLASGLDDAKILDL